MDAAEAPALRVGVSLRVVAIIALAATVLGRALAPALRGAGQGLGTVINFLDDCGSWATHLYAIAAITAIFGAVARLAMTHKVGSVTKGALVALALLVVLTSTPALVRPLAPIASVLVGVSSATLALIAAGEGVLVPRTRALAFLLATTGAAALLHVIAACLAWYAASGAPHVVAVLARAVATGSMAFDTASLLVALAWLGTRGNAPFRWTTRLALLVASLIAFGALRGGVERAALWEIVAHRALDNLLAPPQPYAWPPFLYLLEALAPALALVALTTSRQLPGVISAFALVLVARPTSDVPLSALALSIAALSACLAAHDERGIWAEILASGHTASGGAPEPAEIRLDSGGSGS